MSSANLEKVIEEVKALTPQERRQVRELIDSLLEQSPSTTPLDLLDQALLQAGVISETPPPITDFKPYENRRPVGVKGKPISETIIEERR